MQIGVKVKEIVNGVSCANPAQAMIIDDLCYEFI